MPVGAKVEPVIAKRQPLVAPLAAADQVGSLQVLVDGKPGRQWPLVTLDAVPEAGLAGRAWDTLRLWWQQQMG